MGKLLSEALKNMYFEIHAIYDPDGSELYGDCYSAAVDLFAPGLTFRVYFKANRENQIEVLHTERWHFG